MDCHGWYIFCHEIWKENVNSFRLKKKSIEIVLFQPRSEVQSSLADSGTCTRICQWISISNVYAFGEAGMEKKTYEK